MTTSTKTRLKDSEFHEEILQLIRGTHWTKGTLDDVCWIPLPEGMSLEEAKAKYGALETKLVEIAPMVDEQPVIHETIDAPWVDKDAYKPQRCGMKHKMCLIGMVLKVADLEFQESYIEGRDQESRIVQQLYAQLPENVRARYDREAKEALSDAHLVTSMSREEYEELTRLRYMIGGIEGWNDDAATTKQDVINLVVRAKGQALRAESALNN